MASGAPIEIWIKIFEEVIDVPEFFSADPLVNFGVQGWAKFRHEEYYWRSERWRNRLRRVHSSWNAILSQSIYQHRFVLMSDVTHGRISEDDIPWHTTIRIAFGPEQGCNCPKLCGGWKPLRSRAPAGNEIALGVIERAVARHSDVKWKLNIVDGVHVPSEERFRAIFKGLPIQAIIAANPPGVFSNYYGSLRQLHITISGSREESRSSPLSFPRLTTLVIDWPELVLGLHDWHLPALQHLQLSDIAPIGQVGANEHLMRVVGGVGSNLRTLHIDYIRLSTSLPTHFWDLVPRLEQMRLNCHWTCAPPQGHPLTTVSVHIQNVLSASPSSIIRNIPGWTRLSNIGQHASPEEVMLGTGWDKRHMRVAMNKIWERILDSSSELQSCLYLADLYADIGWTLTDHTGMTINELIILLLKKWRPRKKIFKPLFAPLKHRVAIERQSRALPPSKRMGETDRDLLVASLFAFECF